jgi:hypothetical protein
MNNFLKKHSKLHWVAVCAVVLFLIGLSIKSTYMAMIILGDTPNNPDSLWSNIIYMSGAAGIVFAVLCSIIFHKDLND